MPPSSLKIPALDVDADTNTDLFVVQVDRGIQVLPTTSCANISSPSSVRSISNDISNESDAETSLEIIKGNDRQEAIGGGGRQTQTEFFPHSHAEMMLVPEGMVTEDECSALSLSTDNGTPQRHLGICSLSISTSSPASSCKEPIGRKDAIGPISRGEAFIENKKTCASELDDYETYEDTIRRSCKIDSKLSTSFTQSSIDVSLNTEAVANVEVAYNPNSNLPSVPRGLLSYPITFVGITLERPDTIDTWGLVFIKDKGCHAMIIRVIRPSSASDSPIVKWCEITNVVPNPALVYRRNTASVMTTEQYEYYIVQNFPKPCDKSDLLRTSPMDTHYLMPGDAILSVNGIPASTLDTGSLAQYIRGHCQRKITMVLMRHEAALRAAQISIAPSMNQDQQQYQNEVTNQVASSVKGVWKRLLVSRGVEKQQHIKRKTSNMSSTQVKRQKIDYCNVAFETEDGKPIPYCDNYDLDPDDESRIHGFVSDEIEKSFGNWLYSRKLMWRSRRMKNLDFELHSAVKSESSSKTKKDEDEYEEIPIMHDFWLISGHNSFDSWLSSSKSSWARSYSWHCERRNALQSKCTTEVHFPLDTSCDRSNDVLEQFKHWLSVRKQQWKIERRKRNRHRFDIPRVSLENDSARIYFAQDIYIDEILREEKQSMAVEASNPIDVTWIFDTQLGAPDDVIVNLMAFLSPSDHGNLLCLSYTTNVLFKQRDDMWKALFPRHWIVPRRPRKSWCAMYITNTRAEENASRKRSDDLLIKANVLIQKGDQLSSFEKLIEKASNDFDFSVNYTSGVVLERNSLLNMAVIDRRHKITKWLVEEKGADIESCDRGRFTPLMNAAWNGDRSITRFLLARGCDRTKVGFNHSSQGLASPKFEGLTAEGWARKRGHDEVAELIRLGL